MVYILVLGSSGGMVDGEKLKTEQPETTVKEQLVDVEGQEKRWLAFESNGTLWISMEQVKAEFTKNIQSSTLRSRMHRLKINCKKSEGILRLKLEEKFGPRKGGHYVIPLDSLHLLLQKQSVLQLPQAAVANVEAGTSYEAASSMQDGVSSFEVFFEKLQEFYTDEINPLRPSNGMTAGTIERHTRRLKKFFEHVEETYNRPPQMEDVTNINFVRAYVAELRRELNVGTVANHIQSLIVAAKYILKKEGLTKSWHEIAEITQLRHMQAQLQVSIPVHLSYIYFRFSLEILQ
ncbi:uncharacterized protein LOC135687874 [Rhopilema esculentum]|uniref:uncharacterized protein LOC135687874 n=1 Tax=Rhopilema esculentum TaxID=499914 RepID=UPI0031D94054